MKQAIKIIPFQAAHQKDIDTMMNNIVLEFEEPILTTQAKKIIDVFGLPNHRFWVAVNDDKIIGTIGLVQLGYQNIVLKSMFVDQTQRGLGVSNLLLKTLEEWAVHHYYKQIYLGTMTQFAAGQRFYSKNGFEKCTQADLPPDFIINPLDTIFYTKQLVPH